MNKRIKHMPILYFAAFVIYLLLVLAIVWCTS